MRNGECMNAEWGIASEFYSAFPIPIIPHLTTTLVHSATRHRVLNNQIINPIRPELSIVENPK
jgi:hypothetical protein